MLTVEKIGKLRELIDIFTRLGIAYYGLRTFRHWGGALFGLVSFELARSMNEAAGAAGTIGLSYLGLISLPEVVLGTKEYPTDVGRQFKTALDQIVDWYKYWIEPKLTLYPIWDIRFWFGEQGQP